MQNFDSFHVWNNPLLPTRNSYICWCWQIEETIQSKSGASMFPFVQHIQSRSNFTPIELRIHIQNNWHFPCDDFSLCVNARISLSLIHHKQIVRVDDLVDQSKDREINDEESLGTKIVDCVDWIAQKCDQRIQKRSGQLTTCPNRTQFL